MTIGEIKNILEADVVTKDADMDTHIEKGCGCDLMSDVLSFIKPEALLLTGLTTPQAVYTAELSDIKAICFVRGKKPGRETIALAEEKGITLLSTPLLMYESCGRLYKKGLRGCSETREADTVSFKAALDKR